jgi:hypothetical protein
MEFQGTKLSADDPDPELPWESLVCNPRAVDDDGWK